MSQHKYHGHLGHNHHNPRPLRSFQGIDFNLDQALDADRLRRIRNNEAWPAKGGWIRASRIRAHRVRVGRITVFGIVKLWHWECRICYKQGDHLTWKRAYQKADHHARTKH